MTVKNISQYHGYSVEQLMKLTTNHLVQILGSARGRIICSCGKGHHCGDEVLDEGEKQFNQNQESLFQKLKQVLATREHLFNQIKSAKTVKRQEKKVMRY